MKFAFVTLILASPIIGFAIGAIVAKHKYVRARYLLVVVYYGALAVEAALLFAIVKITNSPFDLFNVFAFLDGIVTLVVGPIWAILLVTDSMDERWHAQASHPRCQECRYNLTGNVSGICPECGTPTARDANGVPSEADIQP